MIAPDVDRPDTPLVASERQVGSRFGAVDDSDSDSQGKVYSLRWIYFNMLEEYARHNGHADLLREKIDGAVGE